MLVRSAFFAAAVAVALFGTTPVEGGALFGSFTPDNLTFDNMNLWLGPDASGHPDKIKPLYQSVRVLEIGWAPVEQLPGVFSQIEATWVEHTAVPIITWMPYPFLTWTSPTPDLDITKGTYDGYIDAFLTRLSSFIHSNNGTRRAYLRFAPAPNGNWFPWSPACPPCGNTGQHIQQTPADFVSMWNYVVGKVRSSKYNLDKSVVQIAFDVSALDESDKLEQFYPGSSAHIDWFFVTGINWGTTLPGNAWLWPDKLFGNAVTRLNTLSATTPVGIVSAGTTSRGNLPSGFDSGTDAKQEWINRLIDFTSTSKCKMLSWHNADTSTDVALFGGMQGAVLWMLPRAPWNSYQAYPDWRSGIRNVNGTYAFTAANPALPNLISDSDFYGN